MKFYNMSAEENRKVYGSEEPPAYLDKFRQISTPVRLWSTEADMLVSTKVRILRIATVRENTMKCLR